MVGERTHVSNKNCGIWFLATFFLIILGFFCSQFLSFFSLCQEEISDLNISVQKFISKFNNAMREKESGRG